MRAHTLILTLCVTACFGCAIFKKAAEIGGPAAAGGATGALVGGPVGAGVGAAAGALLGDAMSENDELRDGDLIGKKAAKEYVFVDRPYQVPVPEPFIPAWVKWGAVLAFLLLKGHHILNFLRGGGVESLLKLVGLKRTIIPKKTRADVIRRMEST